VRLFFHNLVLVLNVVKVLLVLFHVLSPVNRTELENTGARAAGGRGSTAAHGRIQKLLFLRGTVVAGGRLSSLLCLGVGG